MGKILGEGEIRVNQTCISVSSYLYKMAGCKKYVHPHFTKSGELLLNFSDKQRDDYYECDTRNSPNQISFPNPFQDWRNGTYEGFYMIGGRFEIRGSKQINK